METPELPPMPLKWPEKLKALKVNEGLPVDKESTVYGAMRSLQESEDPEVNVRTFTIRASHVYRLS